MVKHIKKVLIRKVIRMKKRRFFKGVILLLVIAIILGMAWHFYPAWRAAKNLEENLNFGDFTYRLEVELNKEELESGQRKVLGILAEFTGFEEEAMYCYTITGSVWEDKIHALIYPKGAVEPLLELYLSEDLDVINEAMLYNVVRRNLLKENTLLNFLVPVQEKDMYMSLEQVEKLFDIDLSNAKTFSPPFENTEFTMIQYFLGLGAMAYEKDEKGESFRATTDQAQMNLRLKEEGIVVEVMFSVEDPSEVLAENEKILKGLGFDLADERIRILKRFTVHAVSGDGRGFQMPTEFVSQDVIDAISGIRGLLSHGTKGI